MPLSGADQQPIWYLVFVKCYIYRDTVFFIIFEVYILIFQITSVRSFEQLFNGFSLSLKGLNNLKTYPLTDLTWRVNVDIQIKFENGAGEIKRLINSESVLYSNSLETK